MAKQLMPEDLAKSGSEHGHQTAIFLWSALPEVQTKYPELKWMFAIPNGFFATPGQKAKMKAEGLKSGVPDICLPVPKQLHNTCWWHGLFIELKKPKTGIISDDQQRWMNDLSDLDYSVHICHGWEQARDCIIRYLGVR